MVSTRIRGFSDVRPNLKTNGLFRMGVEADAQRMGARLVEDVAPALGECASTVPLTPDLGWHRRVVQLPLQSGDPVHLTLYLLRIASGIRLVTFDAEPVGAYSRFLAAEAPDVWALGYTNGMVGYLPADHMLAEGGYEPVGSLPHFGLHAPFAPGTEQRVRDGLLTLLGHSVSRRR